ncbi:hypothetical protein J4731_23475 [Providencia rettgeri]|nr:hypothetical protein [Providencia rettgeri]
MIGAMKINSLLMMADSFKLPLHLGLKIIPRQKPDFTDFQLENEWVTTGLSPQVASGFLSKCQSETSCNKVSESSPTHVGMSNL